MNRSLHFTAFAAGLLALGWIAAGYATGHPLALALVALIAAVYLAGAAELRRFRRATAGLDAALQAVPAPPAALEPWLAALPEGLRGAVRLRIEGERAALPGPALAPTLAGLLVLLGMLGTFLGMVATLKGTGLALEQASDVEAIRASLAAPVKGLGLAFGTSVAGVAASAMLGLMVALARRERQRSARALDAAIAGALRGFSRAARREAHDAATLRLLQAQADTLPALVTQLQALATQIGQQGEALHGRLLSDQARFHADAQRGYTALADTVDQTLRTSLAEGARLAGAAIEPAVQATLAGLAREHATLQATLGAATQRQLEGSAALLETGLARLGRTLDAHAARQQQVLAQAQQAQAEERAAQAQAHTEALLATLDARQHMLCDTLERGAQAAAAQAQAQAEATRAEIERLVQAAAEAPRAAAAVIGELRQALSDSLLRDNAALDERNRLLATLGELLDALRAAGGEQRAAIDALLASAAEVLERAGTEFAAQAGHGATALQAAATQAQDSATALGALGEGFGAAVQQFGEAGARLAAQLQRIEQALGLSLARSDEQLAYYVAQAREIVDLTLGSQKQIVDELQQVARRAAPAEADAA